MRGCRSHGWPGGTQVSIKEGKQKDEGFEGSERKQPAIVYLFSGSVYPPSKPTQSPVWEQHQDKKKKNRHISPFFFFSPRLADLRGLTAANPRNAARIISQRLKSFLKRFLWEISVVNELAQRDVEFAYFHIFIYLDLCCSWHTDSAFTAELTQRQTPKHPIYLNHGLGWMCDSGFFHKFLCPVTFTSGCGLWSSPLSARLTLPCCSVPSFSVCLLLLTPPPPISTRVLKESPHPLIVCVERNPS